MASHSKRRQILEAALHCFTTRGVEATTIEDIRARSNASVGSIYHHFGSKEELASALYLAGLQSYQEGFLRELKRHRKAESGIRAVVSYHLGWIRNRASLARYLLYSREAEFLAPAEGAINELNRPFADAIMAWLRPHVEGGIVADLPLDLFQPILVGPLHQFSRQWLAGRVTATMDEAQEVLGRAVWRALRAP